MQERIIVSLTTWSKRIGNIPTVLDSIFSQTLPPDFVVLNLAFDEVIPDEIKNYINNHTIEINRVPDTKVYKKLIPTLLKYPEDCIISIDDDWIYPPQMIEDFMNIHQKYPKNPISGNKFVYSGVQCHCGCASLTKAIYFGEFLNNIDDDVIRNCTSDDSVYTFFCNKSGHPYIRTSGLYFTNMESYNNNEPYSQSLSSNNAGKSFNYLINRFGRLKTNTLYFTQDKYTFELIEDILSKTREQMDHYKDSINYYKKSYDYRIGFLILKPIRWIVNLLQK